MVGRAVRALACAACLVGALAAGGCGGGGSAQDGAPLVTATVGVDAGTAADAAFLPDAGAASSSDGVAQASPSVERDAAPAATGVSATTGQGPGFSPPTAGPGSQAPLRDAAAEARAVDATPDVQVDAERDARADARVERFVPDAGASIDALRDVRQEVSPEVAHQMCGRIRCDCTLDGIRLWGNVTYVTSGATFKVSATAAPDLFVQSLFVASSCGEWAEVPQPQEADFTVEFVTSGEDFQIEYSIAPGVAKAPGAP